MSVLISGVAGDIGFGVARVLREWNYFDSLIGIDIHSNHPGMAILDNCAIAPRATDSNYLDWLSNYICEIGADFFIPTSEAEIKTLSNQGIEKLGSATVIINNEFTVNKSLDKYECLTYLDSCGVKIPTHGLVGYDLPQEYPVVVKPRSGQGSKGVHVVRTPEELMKYTEGYVWQQYLESEDEEYTCPIYSSDSTATRSLLLKRKLVGGLTGSGVVTEHAKIEEYVRQIAGFLQLNGAINIQLRLTEAGPLLFEINPRISSTVVFRDKLGFNDLRWWLSDKLGIKTESYLPPKPGTRFYRGSQEYILSN